MNVSALDGIYGNTLRMPHIHEASASLHVPSRRHGILRTGVDDRDIFRGFRPARCNTQVQAGCQVARYHKSRFLEGSGLGPPNTAF